MFNRYQDVPLRLRDQGDEISVTWNALYSYCGPSQVIATALFYRLAEQAFRELSSEQPPRREALAFLTAFPGRGVLECLEIVTRLPTLAPDRVQLDLEAGPPEAPAAFAGRFYFEFQIGDRRRSYVPVGDYLDDEFRSQVAAWQHTVMNEEQYNSYMDFKWKKAQALMNHRGDLFLSAPQPALQLSDPREGWFGIESYRRLFAP